MADDYSIPCLNRIAVHLKDSGNLPGHGFKTRLPAHVSYRACADETLLSADKFRPDTVLGVFFPWRTLYSRVSTVKTIINR